MASQYSETERAIIKEVYPKHGLRTTIDALVSSGFKRRTSRSLASLVYALSIHKTSDRGRKSNVKVSCDEEVVRNVELAKKGPEFLPPELGITRKWHTSYAHRDRFGKTGTSHFSGKKML